MSQSRWPNLMPVALAFFAVLLALKLVGEIGWSWWCVAAPLWGPVAALVGFVVLVLVCVVPGVFIVLFCSMFLIKLLGYANDD